METIESRSGVGALPARGKAPKSRPEKQTIEAQRTQRIFTTEARNEREDATADEAPLAQPLEISGGAGWSTLRVHDPPSVLPW